MSSAANDPRADGIGVRADAAGGNLFGDLPTARDAEVFTPLWRRPDLRVERIVSHGQASAPDAWYDSAEDEWVVLLRGAAAVWIEGEAAPRELRAGDWLYLPAHCRHRVHWTDPAQPSVWLAVHAAAAVPAKADDHKSQDESTA